MNDSNDEKLSQWLFNLFKYHVENWIKSLFFYNGKTKISIVLTSHLNLSLHVFIMKKFDNYKWSTIKQHWPQNLNSGSATALDS